MTGWKKVNKYRRGEFDVKQGCCQGAFVIWLPAGAGCEVRHTPYLLYIIGAKRDFVIDS